jgi:5-(aminomethyl)-3-furanmethanol phosphate kinase
MTGVRVIKLGGSLLDWPELSDALRRWREKQPPMRDLMVVGGGAWADLMREADGRFRLGEEHCHWLCLELMSFTARLAATLFPEAPLADKWDLLAAGETGSLTIVDIFPLMNESPLPQSWDVTSDSLAAWLAERMEAAELVLLKSTVPPAGCDLAALAACGYVDRYFPQAASQSRKVRCVNLRDSVP